MDLTILYRGPLASCDYDCPYCPLTKCRDTTAQLRADRQNDGRPPRTALRRAGRGEAGVPSRAGPDVPSHPRPVHPAAPQDVWRLRCTARGAPADWVPSSPRVMVSASVSWTTYRRPVSHCSDVSERSVG